MFRFGLTSTGAHSSAITIPYLYLLNHFISQVYVHTNSGGTSRLGPRVHAGLPHQLHRSNSVSSRADAGRRQPTIQLPPLSFPKGGPLRGIRVLRPQCQAECAHPKHRFDICQPSCVLRRCQCCTCPGRLHTSILRWRVTIPSHAAGAVISFLRYPTPSIFTSTRPRWDSKPPGTGWRTSPVHQFPVHQVRVHTRRLGQAKITQVGSKVTNALVRCKTFPQQNTLLLCCQQGGGCEDHPGE
jgi:hypothetical protein